MAESGKGFDLASLVAKETARVTFVNPLTGKEIPDLWMDVYSKDSEQFQRAENKINAKRWRKLRTRSGNIDPAEQRHDEVELLAACIANWGGPWELDQKPLPYSPQNAMLVLERVPAIREQLDLFVGDRSNFLAV